METLSPVNSHSPPQGQWDGLSLDGQSAQGHKPPFLHFSCDLLVPEAEDYQNPGVFLFVFVVCG